MKTAALQDKCKDALEGGAIPSIWWKENIAWIIGTALLTAGRRLDHMKIIATAIEDNNSAGLRP